MEPRFIWSDVWLLMSIYMADQSRGASLRDIISIGDYINHSIFSASELRCGLAKLSYSGYILERESRFFLHGRAQEFSTAQQEKPPQSLSKLEQALDKFLGAEPHIPGQPDIDDPDWQYPGITDEVVAKAYQEYMGRFGKKDS